MSLASDIVSELQSDSSLATTLSGGIYSFEATGQSGISVSNTPAAFSGARILPCAVVKARREYTTFDIRDPQAQVASIFQAIEIWIYEDFGYTNIEAAMQRIYELLHEQRFSFGLLMYAGTGGGKQAEELNGASFERMDFQRVALRQPNSS